jgi:hypothetical protein
MASFKDCNGRDWPLRKITWGRAADELKALGLSLDTLGRDLEQLAELAENRPAFAAALWWFVEPAAAGVGRDDFFAALDGDAWFAAITAVREAVVDFFPMTPAARAQLLARMAASTEATFGAMFGAPDGSIDSSGKPPASPASTPGA